jgi:hypothetical protein
MINLFMNTLNTDEMMWEGHVQLAIPEEKFHAALEWYCNNMPDDVFFSHDCFCSRCLESLKEF